MNGIVNGQDATGYERTPDLTLRRVAAATSIQLSYGRALSAYRTWLSSAVPIGGRSIPC